jgi:putative ABC transport system permease protein
VKLAFYAKSAYYNLLYSKLRAFLTILGILVGTASVVALISAGELATEQALAQFKALGTDLLSINFYVPDNVQIDSSDYIKQEMLESLTEVVPGVIEAAPYITTYNNLSYKRLVTDVSIIGVSQSLSSMISIKLLSGRFISDLDENQYFCVVGYNIFKFMRVLDAVGKRIKIGGTIFTVVGVADLWQENSFFTENINDSVIVPLKSIQLVNKRASIQDVILRLNKDANIDDVKTLIGRYLSLNAPAYKYNFRSSKEIIKGMSDQQDIFTILLGMIGGIALFVGGIGIMNIMLVSVVERRHEIGLRIAIGAHPRDIQWMFLMEAIMVAVLGGGLGVLLGIVSTYIIARTAGWAFQIFILPPLIGFLVSVLVSVFFGFYPAYKASHLNPIEALHSE